jgi:hypothetical protein
MGFLGGDNEPSRGEQLADEQLNMNKAELEAKKQSLFQTRLDIIKGQGGQSWVADKSPKSSGKGGAEGFPFGGRGFLGR